MGPEKNDQPGVDERNQFNPPVDDPNPQIREKAKNESMEKEDREGKGEIPHLHDQPPGETRKKNHKWNLFIHHKPQCQENGKGTEGQGRCIAGAVKEDGEMVDSHHDQGSKQEEVKEQGVVAQLIELLRQSQMDRVMDSCGDIRMVGNMHQEFEIAIFGFQVDDSSVPGRLFLPAALPGLPNLLYQLAVAVEAIGAAGNPNFQTKLPG